MPPQCIDAAVYQDRELADPLNSYVVLAFFLTLIMTILLVVLTVKYITFHLQKQKEKELGIKERRKFGLPAKMEDEDINSDEEFEWSDSIDNGTDDLPLTTQESNIQCNLFDDAESDIEFETNYLGQPIAQMESPVQEKLNLEENTYVSLFNNDLQKINVSMMPCSPFVSLLQHGNESTDTQFSFHLLHDFLFFLACFRQDSFQFLLDFQLERLCKLQNLSEDSKLFLKSKYEQKLDDNLSLQYSINELIVVSRTILEISKETAVDLKECAEPNSKGMSDSGLTQIFSALHLDCIKVLSSELPSLVGMVQNNESNIYECQIDVYKIFMMLKYRVFLLQQCIFDEKKENEHGILSVIGEYKRKILMMLDEVNRTLIVDSMNVAMELKRTNHEEFEKLTSKQKQEQNDLKVEILETNQVKNENKLQTFQKYLTAMFSNHLKERQALIVELTSYEIVEVKQLFQKYQKLIMNKMNNLEEELFATLQNSGSFSDNEILSLVEKVQTLLQTVKEQFNGTKSNVLNDSLKAIEEQVASVSVVMNHIMQRVSFEYKFLVRSISDSLFHVPVFDTEIIEKILPLVKQKLSVISFDLVISLCISLISCPMREKNVRLAFTDKIKTLQSEISLHNGADPTTAINNDLADSQYVDCNLVNELYLKYDPFIVEAIHENFLRTFENDAQKQLVQFVGNHHSDQYFTCKMTEKVASVLHQCEPAVEQIKEAGKYLSRKGSSFKKKSKVEKIEDEYESLLGMKQTKFDELVKDNADRKHSQSLSQKDKSQVPNQLCVNTLNSALEVTEISDSSECMRNLIELERCYMIERFSKKLALYMDEAKEHSEGEKISKTYLRENKEEEKCYSKLQEAKNGRVTKRPSKLSKSSKITNEHEKTTQAEKKGGKDDVVSSKKSTGKMLSRLRKSTVSPEAQPKF